MTALPQTKRSPAARTLLALGLLLPAAGLAWAVRSSAAAPGGAAPPAAESPSADAPLRDTRLPGTTATHTPVADDLFDALHRAAPRLDTGVLSRALEAVTCAESQGLAAERPLLTVIDYDLPSTRPRLWVLDLARRSLLARELVAHGVGSGENYARRFSNVEGSRQSSLGLFLTADTYQGKNGYSLRLRGLEPGLNDLALERTIVMHGAWYVSPEFAAEHGRLGRSWGCPALERRAARRVIDLIKDGTLLFVDSTQTAWHGASRFLGTCDGPPSTPPTGGRG